MNFLNNSEFVTQEYSLKTRFSLPFKNYKCNNISFKNSIHMINSEKKPNNHRQYLIGFIRDNNSKNRKSPTPRPIISTNIKEKKDNLEKVEEEETIDKDNFFNDHFYEQNKIEKNDYNKYNNDKIMDISDYIGEDSKRPLDIGIMNVKMHNFQPGRISSKSFGLINSYAANTNQGIDRNYNDDRVKIMININRPINYKKKAPWPLISFFAIFDGHNGDHCAEFLRQNLLQYIYTNSNFPMNIEKAIKEAFIQADEDYLKNYAFIKNSRNNTISPNYLLEYYNNSGSCGLILLIVDTKIYIANVGDSRCIMSCENGKIKRDVTRDHKPEFPYEKTRIYDNGGNIYRNETVFNGDFLEKPHNKILLGPYRVNPGKLSVSRTIGDAKAKLEKLGGIPNVIIPEPDIYVFDFYKDNIDYFILGCDGIFDRLKSCEIFQCVDIIVNKTKELIEKNNKFNNSFNTSYDKKINMSTTCGNVVDMILRASMLRKSYDNVTCIMVAFKDLLFSNNTINNNEINENSKNLVNEKMNFHLHNGHKHKDIKIINLDIDTNYNKFQQNNEYTDNDINMNNFTYKEINKYNNTFNNNFLFIDNKNIKENNDIYKNKSENRNNSKINNHSRFPSQSQEKKIRELISLFSINNKKGTNNDNSRLLYRSYGSKTDIIKEQNKIDVNNNNDIINTKDEILNSNNINNLTISQENNEKVKVSRNKDNSNVENTEKNKKLTFFKKNNIELRNNDNLKNTYIKKNKSINNDSSDNKDFFGSFGTLNLKTKENNNYKNENGKNNDNCIENNNTLKKNNAKINSKNIIYETPNKIDNFSKRITTRKIIRKTNNILNLRNNINEKIEINKNEHNLTLSNRDNFLTSMTTKNKETNELLKSSEYPTNYKNSSLNIKKNVFNFDKYKYRNLRYENKSTKEKENEINNYKVYKEFINKTGKYENKRAHNSNLPVSSSVGIIYTKKNKIK